MPAERTLLRGGHVADGTGSPLIRKDVLVEDGRITQLREPSARTERDAAVIDAGGLIVSPGFIDLHSHADFTVEAATSASVPLSQGVTSLVTGNCGWSPFPVSDPAELASRSAFLGTTLSWQWRDLEGFASRINRARPAINVLPQVGHVPVRLAVLHGEHRAPSPAELHALKNLVDEALLQGAWGLSTGLIYAPGSFAEPRELEALVSVTARRGALYSTHMRDETGALLASVDEAISTAMAARSEGATPRLQISHLKAMGPANHGTVPAALDRIEAAHAAGLDIAADVYPYTASGTTLASRLPAWAQEGSSEDLSARLNHPESRERMRTALELRFVRGDFDPAGIVLASLPEGRFSSATGNSLTDLAHELSSTPAETALTVLAAHHGLVRIINHAMSESDVRAAIAHPLVAIASDGGALAPTGNGMTHPRAFGTFPRLFARYVREQHVLTLEEAVRKCTSLPASRLGILNRGVIREGAIADLAIFDPDEIQDNADYIDARQLATGVRTVLVGGRIAWHDGEETRAGAGGVRLHPKKAKG